MPHALRHVNPPEMFWATITGWAGGSRARHGTLDNVSCPSCGQLLSSQTCLQQQHRDVPPISQDTRGSVLERGHSNAAATPDFCILPPIDCQCELQNKTITLSLWDVKPLLYTDIIAQILPHTGSSRLYLNWLSLGQREPRLKITVAQHLNMSLPLICQKILFMGQNCSVRYISCICLKSFLPENSWPFLQQGFTILVLDLQQHVKELVHREAVSLQRGGGREQLQIRKSHQQAAEDYFLYLIGSTWANSPQPPPQGRTVLVEGFRQWFTEVVGPRTIKGWAGCKQEAQGLGKVPKVWSLPTGWPADMQSNQAVHPAPQFMHRNAKKEARPLQQARISHLTLLTDTIYEQKKCQAR